MGARIASLFFFNSRKSGRELAETAKVGTMGFRWVMYGKIASSMGTFWSSPRNAPELHLAKGAALRIPWGDFSLKLPPSNPLNY